MIKAKRVSDYLFWLSLIPQKVGGITVKTPHISFSLEDSMVSIGQSLTRICPRKILSLGMAFTGFQRLRGLRAKKIWSHCFYFTPWVLAACLSQCLLGLQERRGLQLKQEKKKIDAFRCLFRISVTEANLLSYSSPVSACPTVQVQVAFEKNTESSFILVFLPAWLQILVPFGIHCP